MRVPHVAQPLMRLRMAFKARISASARPIHASTTSGAAATKGGEQEEQPTLGKRWLNTHSSIPVQRIAVTLLEDDGLVQPVDTKSLRTPIGPSNVDRINRWSTA